MSSNAKSSSWDWPLKSGLASIVSMVLTAIGLALPLKWAVVPVVGLVVLLYFVLHNPLGRYLRLSVIVVGIWSAVIFHSAIDVSLFSQHLGSAEVAIGKTEWYVHFLCVGLAAFLLYLDFRSREGLLGKGMDNLRLTKNRLIKYKLSLIFKAYVISISILFLIASLEYFSPHLGVLINNSSAISHKTEDIFYRELKEELELREDTIRGLFQRIESSNIPKHEWKEKIREIAIDYKDMRVQLAALSSNDPKVTALRIKADDAVDALEFDKARAYLSEAKALDLLSISDLKQAYDERRRSAAQSEAANAAILKTELKYMESVASYSEAIDLLPNDDVQLIAKYKHEKADLLYSSGNWEQAKREFDSIIDFKESKFGVSSIEVAESLVTYAWIYHDEQHYEISREMLETAVEIYHDKYPLSVEYGNALSSLGDIYRHLYQFRSSEKAFEEALVVIENTSGSNSDDYASALNNYSQYLSAVGRTDDAFKKLAEAQDIALKHYRSSSHPEVLVIENNIAGVLWRKGENKKAARHMERVYEINLKRYGEGNVSVAFSAHNLAKVYEEMGSVADAKKYYEISLSAFDTWETKPPLYDSISDSYRLFISQNKEDPGFDMSPK
ncbi:MAG: tetratricopeptide repeat protein [Candidatus Thiodiazotropha sp.]